jgi:hypothetical protein
MGDLIDAGKGFASLIHRQKNPERFGVKGLLFKHAGPEGGNQLVNNEKHGNKFSRDKKLICVGVHILPNSTGFASITIGYRLWRRNTRQPSEFPAVSGRQPWR